MTLRSKVVRGSAWVVAFRWVARLLGLINVAVIARILSPTDFGLVAMAMLVLSFIEAWLAFGLENACVQRRDLTREHLDTAWSMRLIQGTVVTLLIAAAAPLAALYFREPRVTVLILILCTGIFIASLGNIGIVLFRRDMDFQSEFKLQVAAKVLAFVIGLGAALWLRNYWALVIGILSGVIANTVLSYAMHPFRPRWDLSRWRELWSFSQWMFVVNIAQFAESRADEALIGRLGSAGDLGLYVVASDLGQLPVNEIAAPVNRVLFPAYAAVQDDPERLRGAYLRTLEAVASVTVPAGIGLALVAAPAVAVVLGAKWLPATGILALIALFAVCRSLATICTSLQLALGRPQTAAMLSWLGLALFLVLAIPLGLKEGALGVATAKLGAGLIATLASFATVIRQSPVTAVDIARSLLRPVGAAALMALVVWNLPDLRDWGPAAELVLKVAAGAIVYGTSTLALWIAMGRPDGPETIALGIARRIASIPG